MQDMQLTQQMPLRYSICFRAPIPHIRHHHSMDAIKAIVAWFETCQVLFRRNRMMPWKKVKIKKSIIDLLLSIKQADVPIVLYMLYMILGYVYIW